jgi:hypothetical protein
MTKAGSHLFKNREWGWGNLHRKEVLSEGLTSLRGLEDLISGDEEPLLVGDARLGAGFDLGQSRHDE